MSFPEWHFSQPLTAPEYYRAFTVREKSQRDIFGDYGHHHGINVHNDEWLVQQCHKPPERRLAAALPSLPLNRPVKLSIDHVDPCVGDNLKKRQQLKEDDINMKRVMFRKTLLIKKNREHRNVFKSIKKDFDANSVTSGAKKCPKWMHNIVKLDGFNDPDYVPRSFNSAFNGGVLTNVPLYNVHDNEDNGLVAYCDALTRKELNLKPVKLKDGGLKLAGGIVANMTSPILELNSAVIGEEAYVGVRCQDSCRLLSLNRRHDVTIDDVDDVTFAGDVTSQEVWQVDYDSVVPTSICVSPYIPSEAVICWNNGRIHLQSEMSRDRIVDDHRTRFGCVDSSWHRAHFGPTPRSIIATDHTAMDLFDLRSQRRRELEIFAIPSKFCLQNELIMASCSHSENSFYHFLATDYNLFMLDQRMPGFLVLRMQPSLRSVPQYMSVSPANHSSSDDLLILANQSARETFCYPINGVQSTEAPPRLMDMPWRASQIEDFLYQTPDVHISDGTFKRFLESSLVSACALRHRDSENLSILQLISTGDLFCQNYSMVTWTELVTDKTSASGIDTQPIKDENARQYCADWLKELENNHDVMLSEIPLGHRFPVVDATNMNQCISSRVLAHERCFMCNDRTNTGKTPTKGLEPRALSFLDEPTLEQSDLTLEPPDLNISIDDDVESADDNIMECQQCGLTLTQSRRLRERIERNVQYNRENREELTTELLDVLKPPNPDDYQDAHSRILCKLWQEDYDITDEIDERFKFLELERKKRYGDDYEKLTDVIPAASEPEVQSEVDETLKWVLSPSGPMKRPRDESVCAETSDVEKPGNIAKTPRLERASDTESISSRATGRRTRRPSASDVDESISRGVDRLFKYDSECETERASVIVPLDPGDESDFDEAELEMFQMANTPGSFNFFNASKRA